MGILQRLHDSEINASIASFFDGVWTAKLGDEMNGFRAEATVGSEAEAEAWLDAKARELFPESDYALTAAGEVLGPRRVKVGPLTPTETTVLRALINGRTSKWIAEDLGSSIRTVEIHRTHIRDKLGAGNAFDLAAAAAKLGIVPEGRKRR